MSKKSTWALSLAIMAILTTVSWAIVQDLASPPTLPKAAGVPQDSQMDRERTDALTLERNLNMSAGVNSRPQLFSGAPNARPARAYFQGNQPYSVNINTNPFNRLDPKLAKVNNELNEKIRELVNKIKESEDEQEKLNMKEEIKQHLGVQYDVYLEQHEAPLKDLEERVAKLRAEFDSRKQAKEDLVKLRLDTLWYDAIGLSWPDNRRVGAPSLFSGAFPNWAKPPTAPAGGMGAGMGFPAAIASEPATNPVPLPGATNDSRPPRGR